jgi:serine/threonine protein kinase
LSKTVLGDGHNGYVLLAEGKYNGRKVAAKIVKIEDTRKIQNETSGITIPQETNWLKKVKDIDGCLKYIDFYVDEKYTVTVL